MSSIPLLPQTGDTPLPLQRFLNEVSTFTTQLQTLTAQVADVASLHDAALRSTELSSTSYTSGASARVDGAVADCSARARALKDFLKALEVDALLTQRHAADDAAAQQDAATKTGQCQRAKRDLQAVVREFEKVPPPRPVGIAVELTRGSAPENRPRRPTGAATTSSWPASTAS